MAASETGTTSSARGSLTSRLLRRVTVIWKTLPAVAKKLQTLNKWLAGQLRLSSQWSQHLLKVEITVLLGGGATMIQLEEYALAVVFWIILALIWISKVLNWKTISGDSKRIASIKAINIGFALLVVAAMVTWTNVKRGDEQWTALEKLFVRDDLVVMTVATNTEYKPGTVINGISWQPDYTELDVIINNPTNSNYDDVNIVVQPDYPVAQIAQMSNLSEVSFEDKMGLTVRITQQEAPLYPKNTPFGPASPYVLVATNAGYRVHCGRIPPESSLRLILALVDIKKGIPYKPGMIMPSPSDMELLMEVNYSSGESYWFGLPGVHKHASRPNPAKLKIDGSYVVDNKRRRLKRTVTIG